MALFSKVFARIPEELPATSAALDDFTRQTLSTYSLPNTGEYQRAVASAIQQATQGGSHKVSKYAVYSFVRRAAAMRNAFVKLQDMNKKEAEEEATKKAQDEQLKQAATLKDEVPPALQDACIQSASSNLG